MQYNILVRTSAHITIDKNKAVKTWVNCQINTDSIRWGQDLEVM